MTNEQIALASKQNYFCNSRLISGRIIEYDIRAANISMCREYGIINDDLYRYLLTADKQQREEFIGWQIKKEKDNDSSSITYNTIHDGIIKAKLQLFEANNIQPSEVIRIANDAVYVNRSSDLSYTKFGDFIEFKKKIVADTVIKLSSTIIIFYWSTIEGLINIELKGIGDQNNVLLHQNYMLSFIGSVLLTYERAGISDAIQLIENFYNDYISRKLAIEFYRELNPTSMYRIINSGYYVNDIDNVNLIDISYNGSLIRELWKILISRYKK